MLTKVDQVVVKPGHELVRKEDEKTALKGRCDSFVVEADVHYSTDINLLLDAIRKIVFLIGYLCDDLGVTD